MKKQKFIHRVRTWLVSGCFIFCASMNISAADIAQQFVRKLYPHGLPYAKARELGRSSVQTLLNMLNDPNEKTFWANIVLTLGIIGDEAAVEPLISLLESDITGEADSYAVRAILSIPSALGHIAGQGSKKALDYLLRNSTLERWQEKDLPWTYGERPATSVFATSFYTSVITALGIAARPEAIAKLRSMKADSRLHSDVRAQVDEALQMAEQIRREGREKVLSNRRTPPQQ